MTRDEARQEVRSRWRELYPASKDRKGIICPFCPHGSNGDGVVENTKAKERYELKCFSCGESGDVLHFIQKEKRISFPEALDYACKELGIRVDNNEPAKERSRVERIAPVAAPAEDKISYYRECMAHLNDVRCKEYLTSRGISIENALRMGIGYDENADPAETGHPCPRLIIPTTHTHYVARSIDKDTPPQYQKMNNKGAVPGIFNDGVLQLSPIVFVVEGAFDALSLLEIGEAAVALNSTAQAKKLIQILEENPTESTLIVCMDNDDAGRRAEAEIVDGLKRLNIKYTTANISGTWKDANEALCGNRKRFEQMVAEAKTNASSKVDNVSLYIDKLMGKDIEDFTANGKRKTGFTELDKLSGGIFPGLYVLAATSSLGKTTFSLQLADQLAEAGNDVLFFSLEQSKLEMVSKSLARTLYKIDPAHPLNSLDIRRGASTEKLEEAVKQYKRTVADRLSIIEGNFKCNVSYIGDYVRGYIAKYNTTPVVFIDYLQILQSDTDKRQTAKDAMDIVITELKRLSRSTNTTIFVISSVNRANYLTPIDFESIKESGGIEYTADVIWGLQLQCLNDNAFASAKDANIKDKREKIRTAKAENPRKIELVCLKNRYGVSSFSAYFDYMPDRDCYRESYLDPQYAAPRKAGIKQ